MEKALAIKTLKNLSILYIEDEKQIRDRLADTLRLFFKTVYPFSNAEDALEFYNQNKVDIILSDISLEQLNGIELAKLIRKENKKIPIILLSAHTNTEYLLEASKLKLVEYLTKPITFTQLENALINGAFEILENGNYMLSFGNNIIYDVQHNTLYENDIEKKLTVSEIKLLNFLIKNKHKTVSMEEIKNNIWEDPYYATETAFKSLLHKLRTKIGKNSIKNVSGVGYFLITE